MNNISIKIKSRIVEVKLRSRDCRSSHSLTKPLNGGSAEMESTPIRNRRAITGIFFIRPPSSSIFFVCPENKL